MDSVNDTSPRFNMTYQDSNNKRIAVNTIMLYIRMFIIMGVSLYTSRIVLLSLGVEDYGIYNVVAGFVSMFTFINSAMTSATQRYITFAIGRGELDRINKVFSTCMNIHALISIILLIVAETFGLWFLNTKMTIPIERIEAANVVFQIALLSTVVMILSVPYNAMIVAYEKMSAFAYISIFDVSFKLLVAYILFISPFDRLIVYATLLFLVQLIIRQIYRIYCQRKFPESRYKWVWDKSLFREMVSFSAWSLFGNLASVFSGQGVNVVLNMFFGPVVNAARGVAFQVQSAVHGFSGNFQMAMNPQITKNYANGDLNRMHNLIFASSKFSYYLLFLISLPVILEADTLLGVWLKEVPPHTVNFLRIVLFTIAFNSLAGPFTISAQANGNIKTYQITVGGILLLTLPLAYIGLRLFDIPEIVYVIDLIIVIIAQIARLFFMRIMVRLSIQRYLLQVILPITIVTFVASIIPIASYMYMPKNTFISFFSVCVISLLSVSLTIYYIGISKEERMKVNSFIRKKLHF